MRNHSNIQRRPSRQRQQKRRPTPSSIRLIALNKPFNTLCQFTGEADDITLANFVSEADIYPAGRLDKDSEGLLLLTNYGKLQARLTDPEHKLPKTYWVLVEGEPTEQALKQLRDGVTLSDGRTRPATVTVIEEPNGLWERDPPVRIRKSIRDTWLELTIHEGKNRQVRRMTAAVNHPTLRLIRASIGPFQLNGLAPGEIRDLSDSIEDFSLLDVTKK